jgi:hypothetical protein
MAKAKKVTDNRPVKTTKQLVNEFLEQNPIPHSFKFFHKFINYKYDVTLTDSKKPYYDSARDYSKYSKSKIIDYRLVFSNTEGTILHSHFINQSNKKDVNENTNPYPLAIRYMDHDNGVYLIERPPFQIEIDYSFKKNVRRKEIPALKGRKIWIPWTVSLVNMGTSLHSYSHRLFVSKGPLTSVNDTVMNPVLPNLFGDSTICFGDSIIHLRQRIDRGELQYNIANVFTYMFNDYFNSWNPDLQYRSDCMFVALNKMGIFDRIREMKVKNIPKNFDSQYSWTISPGKFWFYFLYTMSFLTYEETVEFYEKLSALSGTPVWNTHQIKPIKVSDLIKEESSEDLYDFSANELSMPALTGLGSWDRVLESFSRHREILKTEISVKIKNIPEGFLINQDIVSNPNLIGFIYFEFFRKLSEEHKKFCEQNSLSLFDAQNQMDNLLTYTKFEEYSTLLNDYHFNNFVLKNNFPNFLNNSSLRTKVLNISVNYDDIVANVLLTSPEESKEMETV